MGSYYRPAENRRNGQPISGSSTLCRMREKRTRTAYGERVFKARTLAKLTQPQLAQAAGMAQGTLAELEYKAHSSRFTAQIATACGVSAEWLATGSGSMLNAEALSPEVLDLAARINALPKKQRDFVVRAIHEAFVALEFARDAVSNGLGVSTQGQEMSNDDALQRVKGSRK
jgi:transcriptional regulator with XRE-family HTH domain